MNGWRYGCGESMTVTIPRGYGYRDITVQCGSTSHTGGVNQCDKCIERIGAMPEPNEDESDMDYFERTDRGAMTLSLYIAISVVVMAAAVLLATATAAEPTERVVCHANDEREVFPPQLGSYGTVLRQVCYFSDFTGAEVEVLFVD